MLSLTNRTPGPTTTPFNPALQAFHGNDIAIAECRSLALTYYYVDSIKSENLPHRPYLATQAVTTEVSGLNFAKRGAIARQEDTGLHHGVPNARSLRIDTWLHLPPGPLTGPHGQRQSRVEPQSWGDPH